MTPYQYTNIWYNIKWCHGAKDQYRKLQPNLQCKAELEQRRLDPWQIWMTFKLDIWKQLKDPAIEETVFHKTYLTRHYHFIQKRKHKLLTFMQWPCSSTEEGHSFIQSASYSGQIQMPMVMFILTLQEIFLIASSTFPYAVKYLDGSQPSDHHFII